MPKQLIILKEDDVLSIQSGELLVMSSNVFKFEEFYRKIQYKILGSYPSEEKSNWLEKGVNCELLSPNYPWRKGKIRLCIEFILDESEHDEMDQETSPNETINSSLDHIRQRIEK